MIAAVFTSLLFLGLPIALVLAMVALTYIYASGNPVLYLSFPQQFFAGLENYGLHAGARADFVMIEAVNPGDAICRRPAGRRVVRRGAIVSG